MDLQLVRLLQRGNKVMEEAHSFCRRLIWVQPPPHSPDNMASLSISPDYSFHGLITYKDTKLLMSSLLVFNRVYILGDTVKSCWYFRPALWTIAPLTFSVVSSLSSLPCVNKYNVYTYTVCVGGGVIGKEGGLRQIKNLPQSPFTDQFF